jgi:enoyl-CoA hydratase/carnithine racemase
MTLESNIVNEIKFLQFNDEKARNAISAEDWINLQEEIESFENSDLKYLVIKHINGNYSAGAQLGETVSALMDDVSKAAVKMWNCKKPIISLVDGIAAGAGANMMLLSDFIIATPETRFIEVFVRRGLVVDFGGSWVLPRIIGIQKAKELIEKLNEQSFISICMVKQQIRDGLNLTFEKSIENETVNQNSRFQHQDVVEGMTAFFEKRQPNYKNTLDE